MQTGGRKDTKKLTVAFLNFAKGPKKEIISSKIYGRDV
jgi:hypothetical protein